MAEINNGYALRRAGMTVPGTTRQQQEGERFPEVVAYRAALEEQGCWFHPGLYFSEFRLKNGLAYPGLSVSCRVPAGSSLVTVPRECLLTTRLAFEALQDMFEEEYQFFHNEHWEDNVLLAYLLHLHYAQPGKGIHQLMLGCMPREVDVLCMWPLEEIQRLGDPGMEQRATRQLARLLERFEKWEALSLKWAKYYPSPVTRADFLWIEAHLISRCFGCNFEYITMIPFMEFFNHSVCSTTWSPDYSAPAEARILDEQECMSQASSDSSYQEEDEYLDEDYDYSLMRIYKITWVSPKQMAAHPPKEQQAALTIFQGFEAWIYLHLDWGDTLSFPYCAQATQKLNILYS
jgi:hypothetical protein